MNIAVHRYELQPRRIPNSKSSLRPRAGALVRIVGPGGTHGYADLHPWPELGDPSLQEHVSSLLKEPTELARRTLWLAERDARARRDRVSLCCEVPEIENNLMIACGEDLARPEVSGARVLKMKCGRDPVREADFIGRVFAETAADLRLDFNASVSPEDFFAFQERIPKKWDSRIEYVEDPTPYEAGVWREIRSRWRVAVDFEWDRISGPVEADVLVYKPARGTADGLRWVEESPDRQLTVTSSMDHPVGVLHALSIAQELKTRFGDRMRAGGLATSSFFEPTEFSLPMRGMVLKPERGEGIGYGDVLSRLNWETP